MKIYYGELFEQFNRILLSRGIERQKSLLSAKIFADNTLDGVYSHGINRFPLFIEYIDRGHIKIDKDIEKISGANGYEIWDGNLGIGNINAKNATERAINLSKEFGIGVVALRNTNHWMRGGNYGLQAADKGYGLIAWTNTIPNMPVWGGKDVKIGNNPLVISIPKSDGKHVIVDTALSQFSYGKLEEYRLKKELLPVAGGYDNRGNLTRNPKDIEESMQVLPVGYWKGSSISIGLDLLGAILSRGNTSSKINEKYDVEKSVTQVFICFDVESGGLREEIDGIIDHVIEDLKKSIPTKDSNLIRYPGERILKIRERNKIDGMSIDHDIWNKILDL